MRKTSVYLTDEEIDGLRRVAASTGRSQSELIRDGVQQVLAGAASGERVFRSMAVGRGPGGPTPAWDGDALYRLVMGEPDR